MSIPPKAAVPPSDLGFLVGEPTPVRPATGETAKDVLPQALADELLRLPGVEGAWLERDEQGQPFVVLYYARPGHPTHLPTRVNGLPTRIVGGEPIRAGL